MMVYPLEGRAELIPVAPPDYVSLSYSSWAVAPSGSAAGTVSLFTNQMQVTYTDSMGRCFSYGMQNGPGCASRIGPCLNNRVFCAPIQMTNNFANPLPDVIVQIANRATDTRNSVTRCGDSGGTFGQCWSNGSCSGQTGNAAKVDCTTSSLVSPVGSGNTGCSYCYANASQITVGTNDGLRDAVLVGSVPTGLATDTVALALTNDSNFGVSVIANYSHPFAQSQVTLDDVGSTPSCASTGATVITVSGGGFGPPAGCTTTTCPASGNPATGYTIEFPRNNGSVTLFPEPGSVVWGDNSVSAVISASAMGGNRYGALIRTPLTPGGVLTAAGAFNVCNAVGMLDHFGVAVMGNPRAPTDVDFGVVAFDNMQVRIKGYLGTITMSITPEGTFNPPGNTYTFVAADRGGHKFRNGVHVTMSGMHTINVTDNASPTPHTGTVTFMVR